MDEKLNEKRRRKFGDMLKWVRTHKYLTQEKLGDIWGVGQDVVSKIETGDRRMDIAEMIDYCKAMGITLAKLAANAQLRLFNEGVTPPHWEVKLKAVQNETAKAWVDVAWRQGQFAATFGESVPINEELTARTFVELQETVRDCLDDFIKSIIESYDDVPQWLADGEYKVEYRFLDATSLLKASVPYLSLAAISRATGICQSQLSLYASGKKRANPSQVKRISDGIAHIRNELMSFDL